MPKEPEKLPGRDVILARIPPEELRGTKLITEPITMTKLRGIVAKLAKLDNPEGFYWVKAIVCYDDDEKEWCVFSLSVKSTESEDRYLIYAIPGVGRMTPFTTKRQGPKGYRTLDTLIRQINDIFGDKTRLHVTFNMERTVDLKNRFILRNEEGEDL